MGLTIVRCLWLCSDMSSKLIFTRRRSCSFAEYCAHFMVCLIGVYAFGCNSAGSEPIWMKFGTLSALYATGPGRFWVRSAQKHERESDWKFCFFFGQVSNVQFHRLSVGQISQNLHTRRGSARRWILLEQNLENFPVRGRLWYSHICAEKGR